MGLEQFVDGAEGREASLVVVNRESPRPLMSMLEGLFDGQPVTVDERDVPEETNDVVFAVIDGELVASSSLKELQESILLVNSDLYITGTRDATEVELPDVLAALADVRFSLRGYPESNKEKLLLITVSRYVERMALESSGGTHRASFQQLSRVDDEHGTRRVYERLGSSGVDTHVYGVPDRAPDLDASVSVHAGRSREYRDSWFVSFVPDDEREATGAIVALETAPRIWDGCWTFDRDAVRRIDRYIDREL